MRQFQCDYIAGCHPDLLAALVRSNAEEVPGYGMDHFCEKARELIRTAAGAAQADVFFFTGGTLTNRTLISAALRPGKPRSPRAPGTLRRTRRGRSKPRASR